MSWYRDLSNPSHTWSDRISFVVDTSSTAGSTAVRAEIDLSDYADFDWLWDLLDLHGTPGSDIRITAADGRTLVDQLQATTAINTTTRVGVLRFDFTTLAPNVMHVFHLYLGNASASSAWGTVVNVTAVDAYFMQDAKGGGYPVVSVSGQDAKSGETREVVSKHPSDDAFVGFTVDDLVRRCTLSAGLDLYEEIEQISLEVLDVDTDQPGLYSLGDVRVGTCPRSPGSPLIRVKVVAGTDGTDYGIEPSITTTLGRILVRRVGLSVRQTVES